MNILCIDYGTKRIGLALATTPLAEPLGIITNSQSPRISEIVSEAALRQIVKLIDEHRVERVVVGISEGEMAKKTYEFIEALKKLVAVPIETVDETLTSVAAGQAQQYMSKTKRRGNRDHLAAAVMLQDYLDSL